MSAVAAHPATRAMEAVEAALTAAGLEATRDAGAFYPQPIGALVGLPALVMRTHYGRTFELPVLIVSADPLNAPTAVDALYAAADEAAAALATANYRPSSYRSGVNAEPLPALELTVTYTTEEEV